MPFPHDACQRPGHENLDAVVDGHGIEGRTEIRGFGVPDNWRGADHSRLGRQYVLLIQSRAPFGQGMCWTFSAAELAEELGLAVEYIPGVGEGFIFDILVARLLQDKAVSHIQQQVAQIIAAVVLVHSLVQADAKAHEGVVEYGVQKPRGLIEGGGVVFHRAHIVVIAPDNIVENVALVLAVEIDADAIAAFLEGAFALIALVKTVPVSNGVDRNVVVDVHRSAQPGFDTAKVLNPEQAVADFIMVNPAAQEGLRGSAYTEGAAQVHVNARATDVLHMVIGDFDNLGAVDVNAMAECADFPRTGERKFSC